MPFFGWYGAWALLLRGQGSASQPGSDFSGVLWSEGGIFQGSALGCGVMGCSVRRVL